MPPRPESPRPPVRVRLPSEKRSLSRSASRALDVLECFGREQRALRAVEIARAMGMNPSTTNQLLKSMVDSGHLTFEAHGKTYLPSPRLSGFSQWMGALHGHGARLHDLIARLQAETGMVVTLATANDTTMQVLDLAQPLGLQTERGLRISLFGSVLGSAWLTMAPEGEIRRLAYRARIAPAHLPRILAEIEQVRTTGHAEGANGTAIWSIAVPLGSGDGPVPLVLGLAGPQDQVSAQREALLTAMSAARARWLD